MKLLTTNNNRLLIFLKTHFKILNFTLITFSALKCIVKIAFKGTENISRFAKLIDKFDLITPELICFISLKPHLAVKLRKLIGSTTDTFRALLKLCFAVDNTFLDLCT